MKLHEIFKAFPISKKVSTQIVFSSICFQIKLIPNEKIKKSVIVDMMK